MSSLKFYLAKLEACLGGLPPDAQQAVMEELRGHLEDRAAALQAGGLEKEASMSEAREVGAALRDVHGRSSWGETLAGVLPFLVFGLGMVIYEILPRELVAGPLGLCSGVTSPFTSSGSLAWASDG